MLAIRMQRTGRKGHAQFRMVVQDSRRTPTSGRVVANLGSYNPHTKQATIDTEKASTFLKNGAQPSERVVVLLEKEGVTMPKWVTPRTKKERSIKNVEKLRRNQPEQPAEAASEPEASAEAPTETESAVEEVVAESEPATEATEETPAES
jgi:small subunit ribosomal protein S16